MQKVAQSAGCVILQLNLAVVTLAEVTVKHLVKHLAGLTKQLLVKANGHGGIPASTNQESHVAVIVQWSGLT